MKKRFSNEDILKRLYFAIDSAEAVFQKFDSLDFEGETREIYAKNFEQYPNFSIRIVTDMKGYRREVDCIHFQKTKKPPD